MTTHANQKQQSWNNSYLLDIPMIDKQHIQFFMLFDKLTSLNKNEVDYEDINNYIEELDKYTQLHFKTEEALMRKVNAPDYGLHIEQHNVFLKKITEFKIAYSYKNTVLLDQMIGFMRKWFLIHISDIDAKYVPSVKTFFNEKGWPTDE